MIELEDLLISLCGEALTHGGIANNVRTVVRWIESEELMEDDYESRLRDFDAILVPGGFWQTRHRGHDSRYFVRAPPAALRTLASVWECRPPASNLRATVCGLKDADSTEFDLETPHPVIFKTSGFWSMSKSWVARCAWASGPASCTPVRWLRMFYGGRAEIGERHRIATNSIPNTALVWKTTD